MNRILLLLCLSPFMIFGQTGQGRYQGLLWEITGNGITRPSYVFGTMHVSNKLAFHLSDSFYYALRNVDAVALELNPEVWQGEMIRMEQLKENYSAFVTPAGNDYINENTFRIPDYIPSLKLALRTEPAVVNNLLYRSYKAREDFEEDTFLDLYIYQTGRKLGKAPAGVENYYEAEKLVLEAYGDMSREKKKRDLDLDAQTVRKVLEELQNAYRKGDLDMLDSLDNLMEQSEAFREKFLFRRNEIQADAIDSIIRNTSLFAGVGAAHLPGKRGVIELLRKKGYTLRPVKMADRDAKQKSEIDKLKVPVKFRENKATDGFFTVDVPGELYRVRQEAISPGRWQFADMSNGSYYMVTRLKTYAGFRNLGEKKVLGIIDSLLYENIPGRILTKKEIKLGGYPGYDISARTRRGDLQRYNIYATPFEVIIFKMSGKENYAEGEEANRFFNSVRFLPPKKDNRDFTPSTGGFSLKFPHNPHATYDHMRDRWEYESFDSVNNKAFLLIKKSLYNFNHIDEDSFYLSMMEESFRSKDLFDRPVFRTHRQVNGRSALEVWERLRDSTIIYAMHFVHGPHYYTLATRGKDPADFFSSFKIKPFKYPEPRIYRDSILNMVVKTGIIPDIDSAIRIIIEKNTDAAYNGQNPSGYFSYWPKPKHGVFRNDSTGELVMIKLQGFPRYFSVSDSVKFWKNETEDLLENTDMMIGSIKKIRTDGLSGIQATLKDTGSSRVIYRVVLVKGDVKYEITSIADSISSEQDLVSQFFNSFESYPGLTERNIYENRLPLFFRDLTGEDSILRARAKQALKSVYYGPEGLPHILDGFKNISSTNKDYFELKAGLINELGFIKDSTGGVVKVLRNIYEEVGDTLLFQNEVIKALARQKTSAGIEALRLYLVNDPPIFENDYEFTSMFNHFNDSLKLSAALYPDILRLLPIDDYKEKVINLLTTIVDSGYADKKKYAAYLPQILIDAKVALKKLRNQDYKIMEQQKETSDEPNRIFNSSRTENLIDNYAVLLMPFYDKNREVREFYYGLLQSLDIPTRIFTGVHLLRNNKEVHDSIFLNIAKEERYRGMLYDRMMSAGVQKSFPINFLSQEQLVRSYLVMENEYDKMDSLVFLAKYSATFKGKSGMVYFYKYRIQKENDWKIAISGLQPGDFSKVNANPMINVLTNVKIRNDQPLELQLEKELKKLIIMSHKSGRNFYSGEEDYEDYD